MAISEWGQAGHACLFFTPALRRLIGAQEPLTREQQPKVFGAQEPLTEGWKLKVWSAML